MTPNQMSSKMLLHFLRYMQARGVDAEQLLSDAGISDHIEALQGLEQVDSRLFSSIYRATVDNLQASGKPVPWAAGMGTQAFRCLCHCLESARNLREVLERASQFGKLQQQSQPALQFSADEQWLVLSYDLFSHPNHQALIDEGEQQPAAYKALAVTSSLQVWHMFLSWMIGVVMEIRRVDLCCDFVGEGFHDKQLRRFCYTTLTYGSDISRLYLPSRYLDYPVVQDHSSMSAFLLSLPEPLIAMTNSSASMRTAVKTLIGKNFCDGVPQLEEVASKLGVSVSCLRRKLIKEDTSFQKIKDECRRDLALEYLKDSHLGITEIGRQLGFKDAGSFSRSFRQWVGESPKAFRSQWQSRA